MAEDAPPASKRVRRNDGSAAPAGKPEAPADEQAQEGGPEEDEEEAVDPRQACSVFVSGLNTKATEAGLREFFSTCGTVVDCHISVRDNGSVIAFVEFDSVDAAEAARDTSGAFVDGMQVRVQPKRTAGGAAAKSGRMPKSTSVYVKFLDSNKLGTDAIEKVFEVCGKIKDIRLHVSKAFCHIEFHTLDASRLATQLRDPRFQVHYSTESERKDTTSKAVAAGVAAAKKQSSLLFKPRSLKKK